MATPPVTSAPVEAPKPAVKTNRIGLQVLDYRGGKTTLCAGCGHNAISERIIDAFYEGMKHRPDSTFGTVNDDVLAFKDPGFRRTDFCKVILGSDWAS